MKEEGKINIQSGEGNDFFVDGVTVLHRPNKIFFDFSSTTPRIEKGNLLRLIVKHNVAIMDPFLAKELQQVLQENIHKYEEKFGKIEKPEAIEKIEKEARKQGKEKKLPPESYFG